jgi:hypothetical protein
VYITFERIGEAPDGDEDDIYDNHRKDHRH